MRSITLWKYADRPNYKTNIDKRFPYSEAPFMGDCHLEKVPASLNDLVHHVDYWGEGKVVTEEGISGFENCYNVNHQYQLVSRGLDVDRKVPNRIPVVSDSDCDTSGYIKDNSVLTVTVAGPNISSSCAKDIARIVNNDLGVVVVYGVHRESKEIAELAEELKDKGLSSSPDATLPRELQRLTYYDSHVAFHNASYQKEELYNDVVMGNYESAVIGAQKLVAVSDEFTSEIVTRLIRSAPRNAMSFAYKLWHGGAEDIVRNNFPKAFQLIFNGDAVTIVNKQYQQPLKLDSETDSMNDRLVWGDHNQFERTSERLSWKILPVWDNNGVTFKLYNVHGSMYLKLDVNVDGIGDRQGWGSTNSNETRYRYYLEPLVKNGTLVFFIINCQYNQGLKLAVSTNHLRDRQLWGHNGSVYNDSERFRWVIAAW